jgi:hypothetical protein
MGVLSAQFKINYYRYLAVSDINRCFRASRVAGSTWEAPWIRSRPQTVKLLRTEEAQSCCQAACVLALVAIIGLFRSMVEITPRRSSNPLKTVNRGRLARMLHRKIL